jgi:hypothetical protein
VWTGFLWLSTQTSNGGLLDAIINLSNSIKVSRIFDNLNNYASFPAKLVI